MNEQYSEILRQLAELKADLKSALFGTPETNYTGVMVRVDRLEQADSRRRWALRTLAASVAAIVIKTVYSVFVK